MSKGAVGGFMAALQPKPEYFEGWSAAELAALGDAKAFGEVCAVRLESAGVQLYDCYSTLHDSDTYRRWSIADAAYEDVPEENHFNLSATFAGGRDHGLNVDEIGSALGVPSHMIERPKRGKDALDNIRAYHIHFKDAEKHQYDPALVQTIRGKDYLDLYAERKAAWERGRSIKFHKREKAMIAQLVDDARFGRVSLEAIHANEELYEVYSHPQHKTLVDKALIAWAEHKMWLEVQRFKNGEFAKSIVTFHGEAGTAKTLVSDGIIAWMRDEFGWSTPILASKNTLEEYFKRGGEAVRANDVKPYFADWETQLGLLSPYETFTASARYQNSGELAPRYVAITANYPPHTFAYLALEHDEKRPELGTVDAWLRRPDLIIFALSPRSYDPMHWLITRPVAGEVIHDFYEDLHRRDEYNRPLQLQMPRRIHYESLFPGVVGAPLVAKTIAQLVCKRNNVSADRVPDLLQSAIEHVEASLAPAREAGAVMELTPNYPIAFSAIPISDLAKTPRGFLLPAKKDEKDNNEEE